MPTFNVPILLLLQVFVVLEGEVTVVLHTTQFNAKKGDSFYIPPKNYYNLLNQKAREAELSLIQVFEVKIRGGIGGNFKFTPSNISVPVRRAPPHRQRIQPVGEAPADGAAAAGSAAGVVVRGEGLSV